MYSADFRSGHEYNGDMVMLIEGVLIGVFAGLVLRPVLDAYVLWHSVRDYADEKGAGRAEERETHGA